MKKQLAGLPVHVHFVTEIREGARKETVAFEANGQYYVKGQGTYVTFQEPNEQGEVKTIIKIQDEQVLIMRSGAISMRSGAISMRQTHVKGEWTTGTYTSELGTFALQTKTDNVLFKWSDEKKKGQLFLTYALLLSEQEAGRYTITINLKEAK
ncbi:DUF1934 domain-containing protein [Bacillus thuringiensis]|uniref:DUF1934 domain-containing protein n=1 Tax=Bacillus thuringiensis TaxID=1428 RepID=UPI000A394F51|nr:DUF1934 domain-containing protein [Bacillus thuringiensis]MED2127722.1 DUF1934 domain-containing protein [Bacillus thuringiensis]MED2147900.1 DUF1934 domain-containing protein [Bacillus thuringiensis]MED2170927.1 DUF1934 domain-containing protein [Bacillus thuringiensis]MED2474552.1 DUF1934 domain-containing protein [Bacillus thuringiensis]MED2573587.1 DUF1934 domain-containing protein [Bacillus thuringiensis]